MVAECIADCKECDADDNTKCKTCDDKYYAEDEKCVSCPGNCLECSYDAGVMVCGKCADGYVLNGGKCDSKCLFAADKSLKLCLFGFDIHRKRSLLELLQF